jgi:benzodiazapine receptor
MNATSTRPAPIRESPSRHVWPLLIASLVLVALVAFVGRRWTDTDAGSWYDQLDKPDWTPPGPAFGIAWTFLYVSMAVAAWLVSRRGLERPEVRRALVLYVIQLALNLGWTATFFAARRPGWAVLEICALIIAIVATMVAFHPISRAAFWLFVPYLAWVTFATALTIAIVLFN